ncbi:hypothetical protein LDI01_10990 [Lentilactobacillus diolivorans]|uniref:DUF1540 domain-containing protein n=1 Tax=Lentilactobacillus diolivorans TaxID=179838 RepID=A0ABQ0XBN1_9LACO|nr:hypothetical protein LDI01_10990 [Lentilactobacillus diolivorans]
MLSKIMSICNVTVNCGPGSCVKNAEDEGWCRKFNQVVGDPDPHLGFYCRISLQTQAKNGLEHDCRTSNQF